MLQHHETSPGECPTSHGYQPTFPMSSSSWSKKPPRSWHPKSVHGTTLCTHSDPPQVWLTTPRPYRTPNSSQCRNLLTGDRISQQDLPHANRNHEYMMMSWFTKTWYHCRLLQIESTMEVKDFVLP